ncbi:hypothetical protein HpMS14_15010 [Helicobacter pylori]
MKLYNKTQELINESESLKQKNNEALGLAKNEFQGYLDGQLVEMPIIVKENVKELVNKEAVSKEIYNELSRQFDKQAITNADIVNNKMKTKNEIACNLKRKELIEEGKLEDEAFKKIYF